MSEVFVESEALKVRSHLACDHAHQLRFGLVTAVNHRTEHLARAHPNSVFFVRQQSFRDVSQPGLFGGVWLILEGRNLYYEGAVLKSILVFLGGAMSITAAFRFQIQNLFDDKNE